MQTSDRASNLCILAYKRSYSPSSAVTAADGFWTSFILLMTNKSSSAVFERRASLTELDVDILALTPGRGGMSAFEGSGKLYGLWVETAAREQRGGCEVCHGAGDAGPRGHGQRTAAADSDSGQRQRIATTGSSKRCTVRIDLAD